MFKFRIPNRNITIGIAFKDNTLSIRNDFDGVKSEGDYFIHPAVPAVTTAAVTAAAVSTAVTAGVPVAVAAGCAAAVKPLVDVDGYYRQDGTYVRGHNRTWPDCTEANNFS